MNDMRQMMDILKNIFEDINPQWISGWGGKTPLYNLKTSNDLDSLLKECHNRIRMVLCEDGLYAWDAKIGVHRDFESSTNKYGKYLTCFTYIDKKTHVKIYCIETYFSANDNYSIAPSMLLKNNYFMDVFGSKKLSFSDAVHGNNIIVDKHGNDVEVNDYDDE